MALTLPASTLAVLAKTETDKEPTPEYEIGHKLSGLHAADGLTDPERKGAWAEASAFLFIPAEESPWGTYYGPVFTDKRTDGSPVYGPDIAAVDGEVVAHWQERSGTAQHPVLRARYADVVWDLKKRAVGAAADVPYAQRAIDAYLDGVSAGLYREPRSHAVDASRRALELALSINDQTRVQRCKDASSPCWTRGWGPAPAAFGPRFSIPSPQPSGSA
jgi:hypothetical protein